MPHVFTVKNRSPDEKRSKIFTFNEKNVHFMCLKTTMKVTKWQKMAVNLFWSYELWIWAFIWKQEERRTRRNTSLFVDVKNCIRILRGLEWSLKTMVRGMKRVRLFWECVFSSSVRFHEFSDEVNWTRHWSGWLYTARVKCLFLYPLSKVETLNNL